MHRTTWRGWVFLLFTGLLALVAAFLPDLAGAGWHFFHGPSVRYRTWEIRVPRGWFALHQGEGVTIERMVHLALWQPPPTAVSSRSTSRRSSFSTSRSGSKSR